MKPLGRDVAASLAADADAGLRDRLERSAAATRAQVAQSLDQLDAVDRGGAAGPAARGDAAIAVAHLLGPGPGDPAASGFAAVPGLVQARGAAAREIVLPPGWQRQDIGPLIGCLGGLTDGQVVALIPRGRGYVLGDGTRVDAALAGRIAPVACAIYPALPDRVGGLPGLARFLWPALRPDRLRLALAGICIGALGLALPMATGVVLDDLVPGREAALLWQTGIGLALGALLSAILRGVHGLAVARMTGRATLRLQAAVWNRMMRLPAAFFKTYSSGDLAQRVSGIDRLQEAILNVALGAAITLALAAVTFGLLIGYDPRLALVALALVAVQAGVALAAGLAQLRHHRAQAVLSGWLSGFVVEVLHAIVKLRVAGAEPRAFARWAQRFAEERAAILAVRRIGNRYASFADAWVIVSLIVLYAFVGWLGGALTAGRFVAFVAAFGAFQMALMDLAGAALRIAAVLPDYDRARPILETPPEQATTAADPGPLTGAIEVSRLTFGYTPGGAPVLDDVSFTIPPGALVAMVGPSGSGKSTLLRLLLGLETPQSGSVLYDGQDLASLDAAAVRRQIGVVLQSGTVFAGSIFDNIRGATQATLADAEAAVAAAGFTDDLASFPMGLHTPLTEGAATLSGGQRQRLLIARALVARPRLLFLDEATSALDNQTQRVVTESLARLAVTRVVIAHRLTTVQGADTILVMDRGRIIERGDYASLMAQGGLFARMANRQLTD